MQHRGTHLIPTQVRCLPLDVETAPDIPKAETILSLIPNYEKVAVSASDTIDQLTEALVDRPNIVTPLDVEHFHSPAYKVATYRILMCFTAP
jgi:hypothetical protein